MSTLAWEQGWWGSCQNTYGEETKQLTYARLMGLEALTVDAKWPTYDLGGRSVLDIGGGPCSILLKCVNVDRARVVDPARWPMWVHDRYQDAQIAYSRQPGEEPLPRSWSDEVWIYNVLQHVEDPERVVRNAVAAARRTLRLFEWINTPPHPGHPHMITARDLAAWTGGHVRTIDLDENECVGPAAYAVVAT